MRMNLQRSVGIFALAAGIGLGGAAVQAVASPFQEQAPDYSKNKTYQQGMREGKDDHAHQRDHSKKRHFKRDQDQRAYEAGYQQGHDRR